MVSIRFDFNFSPWINETSMANFYCEKKGNDFLLLLCFWAYFVALTVGRSARKKILPNYDWNCSAAFMFSQVGLWMMAITKGKTTNSHWIKSTEYESSAAQTRGTQVNGDLSTFSIHLIRTTCVQPAVALFIFFSLLHLIIFRFPYFASSHAKWCVGNYKGLVIANASEKCVMVQNCRTNAKWKLIISLELILWRLLDVSADTCAWDGKLISRTIVIINRNRIGIWYFCSVASFEQITGKYGDD